MAFGKFVRTLCIRVLFYNDSGDDDVGNDNGDDEVNLEKENSDSKEDTTTNFVDDVKNMVSGVDIANSSTHNSRERKKITYFIKKDGRKSKKGGSKVGAQLVDRFDRLLDNIFTKSECTSTNKYKKWCRITEMIVELHFIDEIVIDDYFHCYTSNFLLSKSKREMWSTIEDLITKLK
jgi:hypothetical protein